MLRDFIAAIRSVSIAAIAVATLGIAPLSACGVKGPLKLPPAPAADARSTVTPVTPQQETATETVPQPPATRP